MQNFAILATPLYKLLKQGTTLSWNTLEQHVFDQLKAAMCSAPLLVYPNFILPFLLQMDASSDAIRAILSRVVEGQE